jgi:hypothetical protein
MAYSDRVVLQVKKWIEWITQPTVGEGWRWMFDGEHFDLNLGMFKELCEGGRRVSAFLKD